MSETIEERAKRICYRLDLAPTWNNGGEEAIELIDDLMAEREKMKEPGMNLVQLSDGEMSIIYDALREYELLYSLAMKPEDEKALKTASTKMATVVFRDNREK